jgi:hypothetical protein
VIRRHTDNRVVPQVALAQTTEERSQAAVHRGDFGIVAAGDVRRVRLEEMNPDEEWPRRCGHPLLCLVQRLVRPTFHAANVIVINIEASIEPKSRIEDQRADEGSGGVSAPLETLDISRDSRRQ